MSTFETASGTIFRFDKYELRPDMEELRKRGTLIPLGPQPFRVLLLLVSRAGQIVTREEIQEELWGSNTFVDYEQGINAVIRRIRTALNDHAETPHFLQTLPRRGYSFVAPVERIVPEEVVAAIEAMIPSLPVETPFEVPSETSVVISPRHDRSVGLFIALVVIATALFATRGPRAVSGTPATGTSAPGAKPLRVAVSLPRSDGGPAPAIDPRSFTVELRSRLAHIQPELITVVDPGSRADLRIDSTLQNAVDGLRVDARIVDTRSGEPVWSETFTRSSGEVADFPLEVALRVTRAVGERYVPRPRMEPLVRTRVSPRALALYHEGRATLSLPQPQRDLDVALETFEKAVAMEPRFAEAWSSIGEVWTMRANVWMGSSQEHAVEEARTATSRALALDPRISEAHNNRGVMLMQFDRSYVAAEQELGRAIDADPDYMDAHYNLALLHAAMGQHEEAVAELRRVQLLDPMSHVPSTTLAFIYLMGHRYNDARAEYHACLLILRRPDISNWGMMSSAIGARRWDDAAAALSSILSQPVELARDSPDRGASFRKELRRLEPVLVARERAGQIDPYVLACFYAQTYDADRAFAALDRAVEARSLNVIFSFVDPRLASIRGDPRFGPVLDKLRFRR